MNFPSSAKRGRRDRRSDDDIKKAQEKAMKNLNEIWSNLSTFAKIDSAKGAQSSATPKTYQPEYDALIDVYRGNTALMIEVNKDEDIKNAIEWVKDKNLNVIFTGVTEGWRVAKDTRYDVNYRNAGVMQKAGVTVALRTNDSENARNLPFNAGFAATYGMGIEEALKSITINPAKIFGLEGQYGSISVGKVINGWNVPIESRHTLLYNEFLHRSPGK